MDTIQRLSSDQNLQKQQDFQIFTQKTTADIFKIIKIIFI